MSFIKAWIHYVWATKNHMPHRKKTYQEEVEEFMEKYGWKRMKDGVLG